MPKYTIGDAPKAQFTIGDAPASDSSAVPDENPIQQEADDLTRLEPFNKRPGLLGHIETGMGNIGAGFLSPLSLLAHPEKSVMDTGRMASEVMGRQIDPDPEGPMFQMAKQAMENPAGSVEAGIGSIPSAELMGRVLNAVPRMGRAMNIGERLSGYESPVIPKTLQHASRVAEAIRPAGGIMPGFEESLETNIPRIRAFAEESGNPLHSQREFGQAAKGMAQRGLSHYQEKILGPYSDQRVSIQDVPNYSGGTSGEGTAELGQIEKRISDINDLTRGANRTAKTEGQMMTAQEKLGLEEESKALRNTLYNELAKRTGLTPDAIRDLRQSYGQQFNIADTVDAARRARLGQTGASAEMGGSVPFSKTGMAEKILQRVRGGQEYIADANLRRYLSKFPSQMQEFPEPQTPNSYMATGNRNAANQEFLHSNELDNSARMASQERADRASNLRMSKKRNAAEFSKLQGETMRTMARKNAANF